MNRLKYESEVKLVEQMKAYKFRIYPNKKQTELINKTIGCARFVFNYTLAEQKKIDDMWYKVEEMYQSGQLPQNNWKGTFFNKNNAQKAITQLKKNHPFLKEVDSTALQNAVGNVDNAYSRYYSKLGGKPKFKSKKNEIQSYKTNFNKTSKGGSIRIEGNHIQLPKLGLVKFAKSREVLGSIQNATIRRTPSGKYFISIACKLEIEELVKTTKKIGVDVGLKDFAITSDGIIFENPKWLRNKSKRLAKLQKDLSRKKYGSNNWNKARIKVAKLHEKIKNQRTDYLQKISTMLINENQVIAIEDLRISNMMKNHNNARAISEVSWYEFRVMLEYKAKWYSREIVVAPSNYPSSQLCSECGYKNSDVKNQGLREWTCPQCNTHHHRDINASKNLLKLAI